MTKQRIAVLMGGFSSEREVSLCSGLAVTSALQRCGYAVTAIDVQSAEQLCAVLQQDDMRDIAVVFVALHGCFGEDGGVQAILEELRLPYTGSRTQASRLAMDKAASRQRFIAAGLCVPEAVVIDKPVWSRQRRLLPLPVVVKPCRQGSSMGVAVVTDPLALEQAIAGAFIYDDCVLIEEYVRGRELTVGVIADEPLPIVQIEPAHGCYDFGAKYTPGSTVYRCPAPLSATETAAAQQAGLCAHTALGCRGYSRVDMILRPDGVVVVLEVNTIPGMTQTSLLPKAALAAGITFDQLCDMILATTGHSSAALKVAGVAGRI